MVPAGNKTKRLSSVNHTKTIHYHHHHDHQHYHNNRLGAPFWLFPYCLISQKKKKRSVTIEDSLQSTLSLYLIWLGFRVN